MCFGYLSVVSNYNAIWDVLKAYIMIIKSVVFPIHSLAQLKGRQSRDPKAWVISDFFYLSMLWLMIIVYKLL